MSSSNTAISLLTQIKEKIEDGRIADLPAVHVALEKLIAELIHQEASEPSKNRDDDLLNELKVIDKTLRKCLEKITSTARPKAKDHTTAKGMIAPQPAPAPLATTVNTSATLAAAVPALPSPALHPNVKPAYISFPADGGPRTVTIHSPGSPNYRPVIRDEHGEIIISLNGYWHPSPLRRQGAFLGEKNLEAAVRDEEWVYGRQAGPKVPLASIPVPADALDRLGNVQPLKRKADTNSASEAKLPSPALEDGQGKGRKRARDEEDDNEEEGKATGDKRRVEEGAEEPRYSNSMPLLNRATGFSFNSEEGQPLSPTPASRRPQPHAALAAEFSKRKRARYSVESKADPAIPGNGSPADSS